jgi:hypothetical protein
VASAASSSSTPEVRAAAASRLNSLRKTRKYTTFDRTMARADRQPIWLSMNGVSQFQGRATMSTGGAAKCVSVPPMEMLTNSRPSVAYFSRGLGPRA